jgi:aryl carrier-like protein
VAAVLKAPQVARDDNFFELGGDSILVLQVIARARKLGVRFTPKQLFDAPTIAGRVAKTEAVGVTPAATPVPVRPPRAAPGADARAATLLRARRASGPLEPVGRVRRRRPFDADAFARAFAGAGPSMAFASASRAAPTAAGARTTPRSRTTRCRSPRSPRATKPMRLRASALQRRLDLGRGRSPARARRGCRTARRGCIWRFTTRSSTACRGAS